MSNSLARVPRGWHKLMFLAAVGLVVAGLTSQAYSDESSIKGRPGLAEGEQEPASVTTCAGLQESVAGFRPPDRRIDLWVSGPLTIVHTDGVLWYLAICSPPGIRVMCVTYNDNGMKVGDQVVLRGALNRQDERHIMLDPCLASRS